jgi:cellulose synthase operon protein C
MKFSINLRFLLASLLCFSVVGLAASFVHALQVRRQSAFLLKRARDNSADKQLQTALRDYQLYLQLAPQDAEAHAEFGMLLAERRQAQPAAFHLETALRTLPDRDPLRRKLVELDMALKRFSDARDHLKKLLDSFPGDATLLEQRGICEEASGDDSQAVESYQKAIAADPKRFESYARLADVLWLRLDRPKDADDYMHIMVSRNPDSAVAHYLRARSLHLRVKNWNPEELAKRKRLALSEVEKAIELGGKDIKSFLLAVDLAGIAGQVAEAQETLIKAFLLAVDLAEATGDDDKARRYAQSVIDAKPSAADGYLAMFRVEMHTKHTKTAVEALRRGIEKAKDRWELSLRLAQLMIEQNDLKEAKKVVEQLRGLKADPAFDRVEIDYLAAQIDAAQGNWYSAARAFTDVARKLEKHRQSQQAMTSMAGLPRENGGHGEAPGETSPAKFSGDWLKVVEIRLGRCYEELGDMEAQLDAYRKAARIDPLSVPARLGVAATLSSLGRVSEALEEYRQIGRLEGMAAQADFHVARLLAQNNLQRDWKEVEAILSRLQQAQPDATDLILLRAETLNGQGKSAEAEKLLAEARAKLPKKIDLWSALLGLAVRQRQWGHADALLGEADKQFGDRVEVRLARGQYLLVRYGKKAAPDLAKLGQGASSFSAGDRVLLCRELASVFGEIGDLNRAKQFASQACDADPTNLATRLQLFKLTYLSKDVSGMEEVQAKIREFQPEGALWHYGEAVRLAVLRERETDAAKQASYFKQALEHLSAAREQRPSWGCIPLLAGQLYDALGQADEAIKNYLQAIDLGEIAPTTVRRAFELLYNRQRYADADKMLQGLEQRQSRFFTELGRQASDVSRRLGNIERAVDIARQAADQSKDWADHLWLGELQGVLGRQAMADQLPDRARECFRDAETSLRQAAELGPEAPETWVGLIRFLASTDQVAAARAMLDKAVKKIPAEKAALALGPCYEALGRLDEAAKQYQTILAKGPNDPRVLRTVAEFCIRANKPEEAEGHLQRIVGGQVSANREDIAWARRAWADILRNRGGYANLLKAVSLIDQNLATGSAPDDLRVKAVLLSGFPQRGKRLEAIQGLEQVVRSQPAELAEVRFALAKLYFIENDWIRANDNMRALLANHGKEVRYLAAYVEMLLDHNESQDATMWLNRLEEIAPESSMTLMLRTGSLIRKAEAEAQARRLSAEQANDFLRQHADQAIDVLHKYVERSAEPQRPGTGTMYPWSATDRDTRIMQAVSILKTVANDCRTRGDKAAQSRLLAERERLVRDYASRHPEKEYLVAFTLLPQGRIDEALTIAERSWPKADVNDLAAEAVDLIVDPNLSPTQAQRAVQLLLSVAEKKGRPVNLLLVIGSLQMRDQPQAAVEIYRDVLKTDPNNVFALNNLPVLLALQKQNVEESLSMVNRAMDIAGPVPAILDTRATVRMAAGQWNEALTDLDEAIRDQPRPTRYFHRALACWRLGQPRAAAEAFREAQKMGLKPGALLSLERADYEELARNLTP